jgi:glycosyltransferase involved in cell wall biosynthesis
MIKISVVTISFNQAKYLEEAIRSIVEQDYPDLEYIIVDPGSTDGSREIIEKYSDRIHKIIFEPDNGPADGLNKGFALATGDAFGYMNADDILLPGTLTKVAAYFEAHGEMDVLLGNGVQLDSNGIVTKKLYSSKWDLKRYAYGACMALQQATFFRRHAFGKTHGFNIANRTCWDGELLVDMSMTGARFLTVDDQFGGFRIYSESISGSGRSYSQYKLDTLRIFQKIMARDRQGYDQFLSLGYRIEKKLLPRNSRKI